MKTQQIISIKSLTKVILAAILLITVSCNNKQAATSKNEELNVSQTLPKPPNMDIFAAAFMGNTKAIHQHIKAGTNLNQKDQYGSTALIIASTFGKTDIAKALIEGGADINFRNSEGSTPLHVAAFFCRTEIVEVLLSKNADKDVKNSFGSTALESIEAPYEMVKQVYDQIAKDLGPLGLKLDHDRIKATRPVIATMLR